MILEGFHHLLRNAPAVTDVVADRIYYVIRVQGDQVPAIVLQLGNAEHGHTLSGPAPYASGFVRITCLARSVTAAGDLVDAVRQTLNGFKGDAGPVRFAFIVVGDESPIPHNVPDGQAKPDVHGIALDARFMTKSQHPQE